MLPAGSGDRLVVCATGPDETGIPSVAVWWTDLSGEPKAGWLFPEERAENDADVAGRLLLAATYGRAAHRRADAGWALLDRLAERTGRHRPATASLDVDDLVAEVRHRTGQTPDLPATGGPGRCPVVTELLATCELIGWATRAWAAAPRSGPSPVSQWLSRKPVPARLS
ncbi:hypothetical protein Q0Z83_013710 [Actinoplanes sichuanensis]|nr:hypothetical protein Q0Z83_013710 [Actinoplanes sichuanensis]